jgi:predicted ferric reductase
VEFPFDLFKGKNYLFGGYRMNRVQVLKIVNFLLFVFFIIQALTGIALFFDLFASSLEMTAQVHKYSGLLFIILAIVHLVLNWGWVRVNFLKRH